MSKSTTNKPFIAAVVSTKGGVGKTTVTANLGGLLADQGIKTLLIDGDVQPTLTNYYAIDEIAPAALKELITNPNVQPDDVVSQISENLHIVYSDDPGAELQKWVRDTPDGRFRLRSILKERFTKYDVILIDTQGAVGPLQEAAVMACDLMISPVVPDKLSASEFLHNTLAMINRIGQSSKFMNMQIAPLAVVLNRTNATSDCKTYADEVRTLDFSSVCMTPVTVLNTEIPDTVAFKDAASSQTPIHRFETRSRRKSGSALEIMESLVEELDLSGGAK
ncbi:MAG: ParA family protein [Hydrogenovibrio sp.]